jgi:hypothetical protein
MCLGPGRELGILPLGPDVPARHLKTDKRQKGNRKGKGEENQQ